MARQDFQEMDPFGWRWQASTEVAILLSDFAADLAGLEEDAILAKLSERDYPDVPGLFSAKAPLVVAGRSADVWGDTIAFQRIGRDPNGRTLIFALITSATADMAELVDGIRLGVNYTRGCSKSKSMLQVLLPSRTTALRITHVQQPDVPGFPGPPNGIDSAWRIAIGSQDWRGTEAAMRCADVQRSLRLDRVWTSHIAGLITPEESRFEEKAALPKHQRPACRSDDVSISIAGIPNEWIYQQAAECGFDGPASRMPLADLLLRTEVFLGLYDRPSPFYGGELQRLEPIIKMLRSDGGRVRLRDDSGRRMVIYRGAPVGAIDPASRRIRFCPTPNKWSLWSAPLDDEGDLEPALAALILDAAWAREILDDGRHLSSFLGPIADDYPDLSLTANYDLRLDDGRDDRPNPMARFKRTASS